MFILFSILIGEIAGMFAFALFGMLNIITIHFDRVLEDIMQVMNKAYESAFEMLRSKAPKDKDHKTKIHKISSRIILVEHILKE